MNKKQLIILWTTIVISVFLWANPVSTTSYEIIFISPENKNKITYSSEELRRGYIKIPDEVDFNWGWDEREIPNLFANWFVIGITSLALIYTFRTRKP